MNRRNYGPPEGYRGPKECQADKSHGSLHFDALGQPRCPICEPRSTLGHLPHNRLPDRDDERLK